MNKIWMSTTIVYFREKVTGYRGYRIFDMFYKIKKLSNNYFYFLMIKKVR